MVTSFHFYLPDEGKDVYDLISSSEKMKKLLACHDATTKKETGSVVFQIPKYDYGSIIPLTLTQRKGLSFS